MKPVFAILTVLAAVAYASPAPEADAAPAPEAESAIMEHLAKRQSYGCGTCNKGKKLCWSCNSGGCSYTTVSC